MINSNNSNFLYNLKIIGEIFEEFLYFPLWWYTRGLVGFIMSNLNFLKNRNKASAFSVWVKNIGTPMYGQTDIQGRIFSFFMRLTMVVFKGLMMAVWLLLSALIVLVWIFVPIIVVYQIFYQLGVLELVLYI